MPGDISIRLNTPIAKLTNDQILFQSNNFRWTESNIIKLFGTTSSILGDRFVFTQPIFSSTKRPWLRFPPDLNLVYETSRKFMKCITSDVYNQKGWLTQTGLNGDIVLIESKTPIDTKFIIGPREVYRHEILICEVHTDVVENLVFGNYISCKKTNESYSTLSGLESGDLKIFYSNVIDLFRMTLSLPRNTHLKIDDMDPGDLKKFLGIILGSLHEWIWEYKVLKLLVSTKLYKEINLMTNPIFTQTDVIVHPELYHTMEVDYTIPTFSDKIVCDRPIVSKPIACGIWVSTVGKTELVSLKNETPVLIPTASPYLKMITIEHKRTGTKTTITALNGRLTVIGDASILETQFKKYPDEYIFVDTFPRSGILSCHTTCAHNRMSCALDDYAKCVQALTHMHIVDCDKFVIFTSEKKIVDIFSDVFMRSFGNKTSLDIAIFLQNDWLPPSVVTEGAFDLRFNPSEWNLKLSINELCQFPLPMQYTGGKELNIPITYKNSTTFNSRRFTDTCTIVDVDLYQAILLKYTGCVFLDNLQLEIIIPTANSLITENFELSPQFELGNRGFMFQRSLAASEPLAIVDFDPSLVTKQSLVFFNAVDGIMDNHLHNLITFLLLGNKFGEDFYTSTIENLTQNVHLNLTTTKVKENTRTKIITVIGRWWCPEKRTIGVYYDEALLLGWLLVALKQVADPTKELPRTDSPVALIEGFYNAIHPKIPQGIVLGDILIEHEFRKTILTSQMGLLTYLATTSSFRVISTNTIVIMRNVNSSSISIDVPPLKNTKNTMLIDALFNRPGDSLDMMLERYSTLFGPVLKCTKTGHSICLLNEKNNRRDIIRVEDIIPHSSIGTVEAVYVGNLRYNILCVGYSPLAIIDQTICHWDLSAPNVIIPSSDNIWRFLSMDKASVVPNPSLNREYALTKYSNKMVELQQIEFDEKRFKIPDNVVGPLDPLMVNQLSTLIKINNANFTIALNETDIGMLSFSPLVTDVPKAPPVVSYEKGSKMLVTPDISVKKTITVTLESTLSLEDFSNDHRYLISFPAFQKIQNRYYNNILQSTENDVFIRGTTIVRLRSFDNVIQVSPLRKIPNVKEIIIYFLTNQRHVKLNTHLDKGLSISRRLIQEITNTKWDDIITVENHQAIEFTLLWACKKHVSVHIVTEKVEDSLRILEFVLGLARMFSTTKEITIWNKQLGDFKPKNLPPLGILNRLGEVATNIAVRVTGTANLQMLKSHNLDIVWVEDSDISTPVHLIFNNGRVTFTRSDRTIQFNDDFKLRDFRKYIIMESQPGDIPTWNDPYENPLTVDSTLWLERHYENTQNLINFDLRWIYELDLAEFTNRVLDFELLRHGIDVSVRKINEYLFADVTKKYETIRIKQVLPRGREGVKEILGFSEEELSTLSLTKQPRIYFDTVLSKVHRYRDHGDVIVWFEEIPTIGIRFTSKTHMGINIRESDTGGPRTEVHHGELSLVIPYDPLSILETLWGFHGLCGEEPIILTSRTNYRNVCVALRLFLFSLEKILGSLNTTFAFINIRGPFTQNSILRDDFIKILTEPYEAINRKIIFPLTTGKLPPKQLKSVQETPQERNQNSKYIYDLKTLLMNGNDIRTNEFWKTRITKMSVENDNDLRWIGSLLFKNDPQTNLDTVATYQNFIRLP